MEIKLAFIMKYKYIYWGILGIVLVFGILLTSGALKKAPEDDVLGAYNLWKYVNSRLQPNVSTWDTQVEDLIASGSARRYISPPPTSPRRRTANIQYRTFRTTMSGEW